MPKGTKLSKIQALKEEALNQQEKTKVVEQPKQDEPTDNELVAAALNLPSEIKFKLDTEEFPLVELGFLHSKAYLRALLPTIESSLKSMGPLINAMTNSWFYLRNFTSGGMEGLRQSCLDVELEPEVLKKIFENWGIPGINDTTIEEFKEIAQDSGKFSTKLSGMFLAPLLATLQNLSFSELIMNAVDKLPDLVFASFSASLKNRDEEFSVNDLRKRIESKMDVFDMFAVAQGQIRLYIASGKISSFFDQIKEMMKMKSSVKAA